MITVSGQGGSMKACHTTMLYLLVWINTTNPGICPNIRIQMNIIEYITELTSELKRFERVEQDSTVLDNIRYLLELTQKLSPE